MKGVSIDASRLNERLDRARQGFSPALLGMGAGLGDLLLATVRGQLPSGPLADSYSVAVQDMGNAVEVGLSNSLPYAGFIEFGFQGTEQVTEHLRMMTQAFGKPVASPHEVLVQSYSRTVDAPAHGPVAQAMEQMTPVITEGFTNAVLKELSP